jgi:RNA polymerase sigma-70 factor (ECF subfamily)
MANDMGNSTEREQRLGEVLGAYFLAVENGLALRREELRERHPDLAMELSEFFAEEDRLDRITAPLRDVGGSTGVDDADPAQVPSVPVKGEASVEFRPDPQAIAWPFAEGDSLVVGTEGREFSDFELIEVIARGGKGMEIYSSYVRLMARLLFAGAVRVGLDASDLVQQTLLRAHRDLDTFAGATEPELVAWLRQLLVCCIADQAKHYSRRGRDLEWPELMRRALDRSNIAMQRALAAALNSPSSGLERRERAVLLANALEKIPADYREVFILRSLEHIPVEQIAVRMGCSANAVHKLWYRAMAGLKRELEDHA